MGRGRGNCHSARAFFCAQAVRIFQTENFNYFDQLRSSLSVSLPPLSPSLSPSCLSSVVCRFVSLSPPELILTTRGTHTETEMETETEADTHACSLKFRLRYGWQIVTSQRNYAAACRSSPRCCALAEISSRSSLPACNLVLGNFDKCNAPPARDNAEFVISARQQQGGSDGSRRGAGRGGNLLRSSCSCKYFVS